MPSRPQDPRTRALPGDPEEDVPTLKPRARTYAEAALRAGAPSRRLVKTGSGVVGGTVTGGTVTQPARLQVGDDRVPATWVPEADDAGAVTPRPRSEPVSSMIRGGAAAGPRTWVGDEDAPVPAFTPPRPQRPQDGAGLGAARQGAVAQRSLAAEAAGKAKLERAKAAAAKPAKPKSGTAKASAWVFWSLAFIVLGGIGFGVAWIAIQPGGAAADVERTAQAGGAGGAEAKPGAGGAVARLVPGEAEAKPGAGEARLASREPEAKPGEGLAKSDEAKPGAGEAAVEPPAMAERAGNVEPRLAGALPGGSVAEGEAEPDEARRLAAPEVAPPDEARRPVEPEVAPQDEARRPVEPELAPQDEARRPVEPELAPPVVPVIPEPDLVPPRDTAEAKRLNEEGLYARKAGDNMRATMLYREALNYDPDHVWARYNLACELALEGRHREALAELTTLHKLGTAASRRALSAARKDSDFDSIRDNGQFFRLTNF